MKTKFFNLLVAGLVFFSLNGFGQRTCVSHEHMLDQFSKNPRFSEKAKQIEVHTQKFCLMPKLKSAGIISIPVHVIVVYSNSSENISDAQIQSQIDVLNLDYRKLNSDWTQTPGEFYNLVCDPEIEFTLQGIERHSDSQTSWGYDDAVKAAYPPYLPTTHLNIWICNIGNSILGYAQFPGGNPSTDGLVICAQYFGSSDYSSSFYLSAPFDKGRTATHEAGHWLNLRHIWGDGGCSATDYVDDTPDAEEANYSCPSHPHYTCSSNDMFMNYMDYVDDNCMYMFTEGQKSRMRAIFEPGGAREAFANNVTPVTCDVDACDGNISLALTLDNYPNETSWILTDEDGVAVASGSGYTTKNALVSANWNLSVGMYTFTIYDTEGDGICCDYGNGSYSITDGCSNVLISGGSFGASEAITFCIETQGSNLPPLANINGPYSGTVNNSISFSSLGSSDPDGSIEAYTWDFGDGSTSTLQNPTHAYSSAGTYTLTLTVTDNGGADDLAETTVTVTSSGTGGTDVLTSDDFEGGWGNWTDGGGDCALYTSGTYAHSGNNAADIQDNSGIASSFYLTNPVDVSSPGYTQLEIEFYFYSYSMETGEDFFIEYYNGSSWEIVAEYNSGTDFSNYTFYVATLTISESNYNFPTNMNIRFRCDASSNSDDILIDDITIVGSSGTTRSVGKTIRAISNFKTIEMPDFADGMTLYPNPAMNKLTIHIGVEEQTSIELIDFSGRLIRTVDVISEETTLDISDLPSGIYMVKAVSGDEQYVSKFMKE